jgi:hypothetical protein
MRLGIRLIGYSVFGVGFTALVLILGLMIPALGKVCDILLRPAAMLMVHDIFTAALGLMFESLLVAAICGILFEIFLSQRRKL